MMNSDEVERTVKEAIAVGNYPVAVQMMCDAGIQRYHTDVKSHTITYCSQTATYTERGEPVVPLAEPGACSFDPAGIRAAAFSFERGGTDYQGFLCAIWNAGAVAYDVDLSARTITYRSGGAATHVVSIPLPGEK